jgi:NAD-dependent dihydropyrimidine dehydrogenase PreA subunit
VTSLCLRDGVCADVCPNESIVAGQPESEWPWYYIDPDVCIDCGACMTECPFEAIFPEEDVPNAYTMNAGQERVPHSGTRYAAKGGEVVDLTPDIQFNYDFFSKGPGHN